MRPETDSDTVSGESRNLMAAWAHGWAISRATPTPVAVPGGWRIDVGLPSHRVRYVLHASDQELLTDLGHRHNAPGTWIKVAAQPARLQAALPAAWAMADTGYLMTAPFTAGAGAPPAPYTASITTIGHVVVATIVDSAGNTAASARLAPAGGIGVIDRVETAPAHRRRGLGSTVMRMLSHHAVRLGMHTGALVATHDGRPLYRTLGWTVRTPIAVAHVPEPEPRPLIMQPSTPRWGVDAKHVLNLMISIEVPVPPSTNLRFLNRHGDPAIRPQVVKKSFKTRRFNNAVTTVF